MNQNAALDYFRRVLAKEHLNTVILGQEPAPADLDPEFLAWPSHWAKPNTIYKLLDSFQRRYIFLLLPRGGALLAGPWRSQEKNHAQLLEEAEQLGLPADRAGELAHLLAETPVIRDTTFLFNMVNVLGETLWGTGTAFTIRDVTAPPVQDPAPLLPEETADPALSLQHMKQMEARYAYENELIQTVAQGLEHRADLMLRGFSQHTMEQRTADPVRNLQNYCIVCNTLLRKAAEQGGVHPSALDRASSSLARRIEELGTTEQGLELMREMVRIYCRLVRKQTTAQVSPFVRRTMAYIESDPAGDLSLHTLAGLVNVNASYLSALFHRETGRTVTEYVNSVRMEAAARLLQTTHLQIQTVAQHCGMSDVNYFSKLFKKHHGLTPRRFRELQHQFLSK